MHTTLLQAYQSRFGSAVKQQGNGWNGPCPLCGGEAGKSDRFVVWPDRSDNLGDTCAKNVIHGIWNCRQCRKGGDTIAYLMLCEGLSFKNSLAELGIEGEAKSKRRRRPAPSEPKRGPSFTPQSWPLPSAAWRAYAEKLMEEARQCIWAQPEALAWLAARGITADAVRQYGIGYLPEDGYASGRFRDRSALGIDPKIVDGKAKKLFIPRGIAIPSYAPDGGISNIRIRRRKDDIANPMPDGRKPPKYMELEGSCKAPMLLLPAHPSHLTAFFVAEAELDAMLCHYASGGAVGAVAIRSNSRKPDATSHPHLQACMRICLALDFDAELDEHGQEYIPDDAPGTALLDWWMEHYPQARFWPTPEGKDPGDAYAKGVDIREWIAEGVPATVHLLPVPCADDGQVDTLSLGTVKMGGGAEPNSDGPEEGRETDRTRASGNEATAEAPVGCQTQPAAAEAPALPEGFTPEDAARLREAMPSYLSLADIPADVLTAWRMWRGIPATFRKLRNAEGASMGFEWEWNRSWSRHAAHFDRFWAFWKFQDASRPLWDWMSDHQDREITSRNLLHIWG